MPTHVPGMPAPKSRILDPFFDTIVEVVDLKRNVVVASHRDDRMLMPVGRGYLSSYEEDAAGSPIYSIWRPRLAGFTRSQPSP